MNPVQQVTFRSSGEVFSSGHEWVSAYWLLGMFVFVICAVVALVLRAERQRKAQSFPGGVLHVGRDFSRYPAGLDQGPDCAKRFREEFLLPRLRAGKRFVLELD